MTPDPNIGRQIEISYRHNGHVLTVERRDIEKHGAYWLACSCGESMLLGEHWLGKLVEAGTQTLNSDFNAHTLTVVEPVAASAADVMAREG